MDQNHEVSFDINKIATSLRNEMNTKKVFSQACSRCIYRVPARLRRLNEEAYTPSVVSIGPLHHGKENLKPMEDHKIMYLRQFLERSKVSVEDLINAVKNYETKLRNCYAETIDLSGEDFTTMILQDAVFIITVLLYSCDESGDHKFFRPWELFDVMWDMCLLENQLPFFILEELLERYSAAGAIPRNYTVIELTYLMLQRIMDEWVNEDSWKRIKCSSKVLHFVDFIRKCQQPTERSCEERETAILSAPTATERSCEERQIAILSAPTTTERSCEERETTILSAPPATKLHQSGVKFEHPKRKLLLDVRFRNGILEIPQLRIHDRTETLFRNLQAFEQCHHMNEEKFVSDYITFISCLVRAPNDVEVLADNKNLKIMLNSDEAVSKLLYNLDKENVVSANSFLIGISEQLNSHCEKPWHKWKANLKQDYFKNPWTAISVAAAAFLLILTVIQTVCSILQL